MSELTERIAQVLQDGMTERGLFFRNAHIGDVAPLAELVEAELAKPDPTLPTDEQIIRSLVVPWPGAEQ